VFVQCPVVILVDRQVLEAVLANLLQNAFKFTAPKYDGDPSWPYARIDEPR
jgi:signal transduction histidine kinase